jgi:hypothetical protein
VPWYTSGTPGAVNWTSFAVSEFDHPACSIDATNSVMSVTTAGLSNALSMRACIFFSKSSSGSVHVVELPASRDAFSA